MPQRRRISGRGLLYFFLILAMLIAVAFPTLIIVVVGLAPGLVSWFTDRTDQKYQFFCVLGFNFAGWFPYLMDLWSGNHSLTGALNIITDVFALAAIYGSAAGGWMIYAIIPPVVTSFMTVLTERRLSALRSNQRRIITEWGDEVRLGIGAPAGGSPPPGDAPVPDNDDDGAPAMGHSGGGQPPAAARA
ncbi:MAG: hypothetical protein VW268_05665 [Rhodospirillaceae bacterium]